MCIFFLISSLEYNCFTMVCYFLLYNKVNQLYIYIYPHIFSLLHLPPTSLSHPSRWSQSTELISLWELCGCFPLSIYFGSIYKSMPLSHFIPTYPSPSPCPQVHSLHLRLSSCPAPHSSEPYIYIYIFFFFKIPYICISIQYLFFSF